MIFTNNLSPILVDFGPIEVRWYGLLFAIGIALNYMILRWIFKREKYKAEHLETLVMFLFFGLVIGARLGEVFFYNPGYYFGEPLEILQIWDGGLSSHGATIGLFLAYLIWCKINKVQFSKYADALVVPVPLTAAMVRIGNFFNSEIVGDPTGGGFGVIFARLGESFPRHPSQLYEALLLLVVFGVLFWIYKGCSLRSRFWSALASYGFAMKSAGFKKLPKLFMLCLFLLLYFGGRFFLEFFKDLKGPLPGDFPLNMGQVLSAIPVLVAVVYFGRLLKRKW